jgi:hypothetical protein
MQDYHTFVESSTRPRWASYVEHKQFTDPSIIKAHQFEIYCQRLPMAYRQQHIKSMFCIEGASEWPQASEVARIRE